MARPRYWLYREPRYGYGLTVRLFESLRAAQAAVSGSLAGETWFILEVDDNRPARRWIWDGASWKEQK